jgi:hypothetical protein
MSSPQVSTQQQLNHGSKNSSTRTWEHKWLPHPPEKKQNDQFDSVFNGSTFERWVVGQLSKMSGKNNWHPPSCSLQIKTESKKNCFSISSSYNAVMKYPLIGFFWVNQKQLANQN